MASRAEGTPGSRRGRRRGNQPPGMASSEPSARTREELLERASRTGTDRPPGWGYSPKRFTVNDYQNLELHTGRYVSDHLGILRYYDRREQPDVHPQ